MTLNIKEKKNTIFIENFESNIAHNIYENSQINELKKIYDNYKTNIIIDLKNVHHIDSVCLGQLVNFINYMKETKHTLSIINVTIGINKTFKLLFIDKIIDYKLL